MHRGKEKEPEPIEPGVSEQERLKAQFESSMRDAVVAHGDVFATADEPTPTWFGMNRTTVMLAIGVVALLAVVLGTRLVVAIVSRSNDDLVRLRILEARLELPAGAIREETDRGRCPNTVHLLDRGNCQRHITETYSSKDKADQAMYAVRTQGWAVESAESTGVHMTRYVLINPADTTCIEVILNDDESMAKANNTLTLYSPSDHVCVQES